MIVLTYILSLCVFSIVSAAANLKAVTPLTVYLNNHDSDGMIDIACTVNKAMLKDTSKYISWYRGNSKLATAEENCKQDKCTSTLSISSTGIVGEYQCRSNKEIVVFDVINMYVISNPSVIYKENFRKDVMLTSFLSRSHNYTLTWYHNGSLLKYDSTKYSKTTNDTLIIHKFDYANLGKYEVSALSDDNVVINTTFNLQSAPIRHGKTGVSKNMVQGEVLLLHCGINGIPMPNITWFKDGQQMQSDGRISFLNLTDPKMHYSLLGGSLRIDKIDFPDRANYTCRANNQNGVDEIMVLVRVKDKLAALWPFLGICAEVIILCTIILFYERMRAKKMHDEDMQDEANFVASHNSVTKNDEVRLRK